MEARSEWESRKGSSSLEVGQRIGVCLLLQPVPQVYMCEQNMQMRSIC